MSDKDFKVKNGLSVANSIGIGVDNPAYSIDASGRTDGIKLPSGNTGQRPTGADGVFRFNTTLNNFEGYATALGGWSQLAVVGANTDAAFLNGQPGTYYNDLTNATGTLAAARFTDVSHGSRGNGNLHSAANTTANGFFASSDKVKLDAVPTGASIFAYQGEIGNAINLDSLTTTGWYQQSTDGEAATGTNYPEPYAGILIVTNDTSLRTQQYITLNTSQAMWHRRYTSGAWTAWRRLWDTVNLTGSAVLGLLTPVDGTGSTLDSDLLDGQHGTYFLDLANATGSLAAARFDDTSHGARANGNLHAVANSTANGFFASTDKVKLDAITYSAADVLSKLLTVDGSGSNLDADLLDAQNGTYYLDLTNATGTLAAARFDDTSHGARGNGSLHAVANSTANGFFASTDKVKLDAITYSAADILSKLITVDGTGSNLDADLLDAQSAAYYLDLANATGTLASARFDDVSHGARGGGNLHASANSTSNGFMISTDKTKLDGIESGATADQTAAEILTAIKTVDGSASGLDADLVRATTPGTTGLAVLAGTTVGAVQGTLSLTPGTDVQVYDATLTSIAALGTAADKLAYTTGVNTWAETAFSAYGRSLVDDANDVAARTTLGLGSMALETSTNYLHKTTDASAFTSGISATADSDGVISSGTYTPTYAGGNLKYITANGAFTLAAPSASGDYTIIVQITNGASAGAITLSGFTKNFGDAFTTTSGHDFFCFITKINSFTAISVQALQ